jgi:tetratricopeptide (TPR) repeat protein
MQIIHPINDFFFILFPKTAGGNNDSIITELQSFYSYGPFKPKVTISKDLVIVDIDTPAIIDQEDDYRKTVALCEKGRYSEAKPILNRLLEKNPTNSEYHRIRGQILSDEGNQEEAINSLIDALRWDSKNSWALLMLGNVFAKYKNDIETALNFYEQALKINTTDFISLTNIGYLLFQNGKTADAMRFLESAIQINPEYPNAHLSLSLAAQKLGDLQTAFSSALRALKLNPKIVQVKQQAKKQAFETARQIIAANSVKDTINEFRHRLETEGVTEIEIVEDAGIQTPAKMELAENFNRPKHTVRYKPGFPAVEHLIMHELCHLKFIIEARNESVNQLFTSNQVLKRKFTADYAGAAEKLLAKKLSVETVNKYMEMLADGINLQAYNTPIDLFIEQLLYNEYPEMRPWQFISLGNLIETGVQAVTDKKVLELTPATLVAKTRTYNLVNAMQFRDLFGADRVMEHQPTKAEIKQAETFYNEYLDYRDDREPGEEYELVQHWAEDLQLNLYFELVGETQYRQRSNSEKLLETLEDDPLGLNDRDPVKEREQRKFDKWQQQSSDVNMAVVYYMVAAIQYFENLTPPAINKIATDIALQGTQGFSPSKENYTVPSIPGKTFTGTQILAWFYASWATAKPEQVDKLGLNYGREWEMAKQMHNPGTKGYKNH